MRYKKTGLASIILIILLSSMLFVGGSFAIDQTPTVKEFVHTVEVKDYGLTVLTDTISFYNSMPSKAIIPSIVIKYPREFYDKMFLAEVSDSRFNPSLSIEENFTVVKFVPKDVVQIDSGVEYNFTARFLLKEFFSFKSSNTIQFILPIYPSINIDSSVLLSNIMVPYGVVLSTSLENFTYTALVTKNIYTRTFENVKAGEYFFKNISAEIMSGASIYLLEVPKAVRTLQFYDDGSIWIMEQIQLKNLGKTNITTLSLNILNDRILSVKLVHDIGPESDYDLGPYGRFTLPHQLEANETYTLKIRYPAPSNFTKFSGNNYIVNITATPPLDTLVKEYVVEAKFSQGFTVLSGTQVKVFENANPYSRGNFFIEYTPKLYWSAPAYTPAILLILVLFAFLTPFIQKEEGEEKKYAIEFKDHVRGKLKLIESTIELYENRLKGLIPKQRFNVLKQEYITSLTRINSSIANSSADVLKSEPQKKPAIDKILAMGREMDMLLKQLITYYDQLNVGKIDKREFEKRRSEAIKRINAIKQEVEDLLGTI
ncbi:MAG: hypothetical protein ACPLZF_03735 [Nitrososphaeria archaeon]